MSESLFPKTAKGKALLAIFVIAPLHSAQAYIDPGSGALVWQLLLAGAVGCLFYIKRIYFWFASFFKRADTKKNDEP